MTATVFDGVFFYEDFPPAVARGPEVSTSIGGVFRNAQLASLKDVKAQLASECKKQGYNAVVGFKYGQRSSGFLASIFSRDDVTWYGSGHLANVSKGI
jgi:hypothetical protein